MILYAWDNVCHFLECRGLQMAKYRSSEIATRVKQLTPTETPEIRIENNKKVIKLNKKIYKNIEQYVN